MRRKSRFISNQLVTLGVLMCLLGVSLEVAVLAKQGPPPPPPVTVDCDPQCDGNAPNGDHCGKNAPRFCGSMTYTCRGIPYNPHCTYCLCVTDLIVSTECNCMQ